MAAFVLVPHAQNGLTQSGERLNLFPGSATPAVFAAGEPFWVGYGFVAEPAGRGEVGATRFDNDTRFELLVDGVAVATVSAVRTEDGVEIRKDVVAEFLTGLPAGWHEFAGRWYDGGRLILSSRAAIQFVER
jgi:hypothetical protein